MTIDQLTDIAWAVVSELEPAQSLDVFDVTDSPIIFHDGYGLRRVSCLFTNGSLKEQIKKELRRRIASRATNRHHQHERR